MIINYYIICNCLLAILCQNIVLLGIDKQNCPYRSEYYICIYFEFTMQNYKEEDNTRLYKIRLEIQLLRTMMRFPYNYPKTLSDRMLTQKENPTRKPNRVTYMKRIKQLRQLPDMIRVRNTSNRSIQTLALPPVPYP